MPLYLVEGAIPEGGEPALEQLFERIAGAVEQFSGEVIELQVGLDTGRVYAIVEHRSPAVVEAALRHAGVPFDDVAEVRLVGPTLEQVKAHKGGARYLVEWDIPKSLTMEAYLQRKKEKAPLYAQVPETTFLRTYVRQDMIKCLCLYDAPDEEAVRRARKAVTTPIDRLTRIEPADAKARL